MHHSVFTRGDKGVILQQSQNTQNKKSNFEHFETYSPISEESGVTITIQLWTDLKTQIFESETVVFFFSGQNHQKPRKAFREQKYLPSSFNTIKIRVKISTQNPNLSQAKLIRHFDIRFPYINLRFSPVENPIFDIHYRVLKQD